MVTSRFRWLFFLSAVGALTGLLRGQEVLALIGVSLLVWLCVEWVVFRLRYLAVGRLLTCQRTINGSSESSGTLWTQRSVEVQLQVTSRFPLLTPVVRLTDVLSEKLELTANANWRDTRLAADAPAEIIYSVRPRAAGTVEFPGVAVQMFDLQGLFFAQTFLPCEQHFRVLPMPITADAPRPLSKNSSALPPPGIHRLQKAGMGGELLDLREYVPGDSPKSIAWKVSARRDTLMIRQHESEVPLRTTLLIDHSQITRCGAFGMRPIDQLTLLAATIAKASLTIRDPVGLTVVDESGSRPLRPGGGNRHYFQLLTELSRIAAEVPQTPGYVTADLVRLAWQVAQDLYPELMQRQVNRVGFFLFPLGPERRDLYRKQAQLANLFAELNQLPPADATALRFDHARFAHYLQRFLARAGCALTPRTVAQAEHHERKVKQLASALLGSVSRGHDNEMFVLLTDLLDHAENIEPLKHAIALATSRHHRVIVICPWPDWLGPRLQSDTTKVDKRQTVDQLIYEGERLRLTEAANSLARSLRKVGASVAFAADPKLTQWVLAQADLVRSGRISRV